MVIDVEELNNIQRVENDRVPEGEEFDYEARMEELGLSKEAVESFRQECLERSAAFLMAGIISAKDALEGNASYGLHVGMLVGLEIARRRSEESTEAGH